MVLDNVYQFLMDKFGRIVIVRGETNSFEVVEPNDEKSGKIRLGRLFYANVVEGKIKGSDDDANKILTQGVVANRNGASASNCVEEIFRIMLIDDMKLEIRYLEDVITNSIIMGIICEDLQRIAPSRKDLFEEEKRDVLNNHREIFDYKYELYRKAFISYINGLNKDNDWNISDKLAFGEVINSSIVECLIGLQYNKKEQTGDRNGVKRATLEKLKKMKEDLERLKNYQNIGVNKDNLDEYYVRLWQKFHMESITRDGDGSKVPLINVMVLPDIREDVSEKNLVKPFGGNVRVQYVRANSGMGKSCMLRSIIVVCIAGYIYNNHMDLMSEDEIKAYEDNKFSAIEEFYFGEMKKNRVPVYIEAAKFNEYVDNDKKFFLGEDLFSLSENYSELRTAFNSIPDEFLFLIDSLDEIEERKVSNFNQCLYNLVGQMCEKNQFIITSRFSGRNIHINEMQYLRLGGFDTEAIHSYLEKCVFLERSEELKSYIDKNVYAYELAQNIGEFMKGDNVSEYFIFRKKWNNTPTVESDNLSRYCPTDDITFMEMESDFIKESSKFHLHVFLRLDSENQWHVDMYIWDYNLYPDICRRIILQNGFILEEDDESLFMEYTRKLETEGVYDKDEFNLIRNRFPCAKDNRFRGHDYPSVEWHTIYFSGHKGVREVLCKAGLNFISYYLECIPEINLIGSTPVSIVGYGVTNKFLRIVNTPEMVKCLFSEEQLQRCLTIYKTYSGYVEKNLPNLYQCIYFKILYEDGQFGGVEFNRALYRRLGEVRRWEEFNLYKRYMELRRCVPFKGRLPSRENIYDEVISMEVTNRYLSEGQELDKKIQKRSNNRQYQYESERYILRMPRNLFDICKEANEQGNCLLSSGYVEKHANGETIELDKRLEGE